MLIWRLKERLSNTNGCSHQYIILYYIIILKKAQVEVVTPGLKNPTENTINMILSQGNLCRKFTLFCREAFFVVNSLTFGQKSVSVTKMTNMRYAGSGSNSLFKSTLKHVSVSLTPVPFLQLIHQ